MRNPLSVLSLILLIPSVGFAALSEGEMLTIVNNANKKAQKGQIECLSDVKDLPTDNKLAALLLLFRTTYNIADRTPQQLKIAQTAAKMVTETPGSEKWLKDLFAPQPRGAKKPAFQRGVAIDVLAEANNKFSIRVLCEGLSAMDLGNQRAQILRAFLKMDIPSPPYPKTPPPKLEPSGAAGPEGLAKWQKWWEENKAEYPPQAE
jgi:hypothetical protein